MAKPDINNMRFQELQELIQEAQRALESKRAEELKVLADGYAKKCEAAGFTIQEAVEALKPYWSAKSGRKSGAGDTARKMKSNGPRPIAGTTYRLPDGGEWKYTGRGRMIKDMEDALAAGHTFEEMAIK